MKSILSLIVLFATSFAQNINESVEKFNKVELNIHADVRVIISDKNHIEITGDEYEMKKIRYEVYSNKLIVEHEDLRKGMMGWFKNLRNDIEKVKITIHTKRLSELEFSGLGTLELSEIDEDEFELAIKGAIDTEVRGSAKELTIKNYGPGDIEFEKIDSESLEIDNYGPGDIKINGRVDYVNVALFGPGNVNAYGLTAKELKSKVIGPGDIKMTVSEEVSATIMGPGDVRIKGNARIVSETSFGPGEIVRNK